MILLRLARPQIKCLLVRILLKRPSPERSRSISLGKARKLSTPKRMEILPVWESFPPPVHALHCVGGRIENGEVLFRVSSKTLLLTQETRVVDPIRIYTPLSLSIRTRTRFSSILVFSHKEFQPDKKHSFRHNLMLSCLDIVLNLTKYFRRENKHNCFKLDKIF